MFFGSRKCTANKSNNDPFRRLKKIGNDLMMVDCMFSGQINLFNSFLHPYFFVAAVIFNLQQ